MEILEGKREKYYVEHTKNFLSKVLTATYVVVIVISEKSEKPHYSGCANYTFVFRE